MAAGNAGWAGMAAGILQQVQDERMNILQRYGTGSATPAG